MRFLAGVVAAGIGLCLPLCGAATEWQCADDSSTAQSAPLYVEVPGRQEFSGRLLVRPLQMSAGEAPGFFLDRDRLARALIEPYVVEHFDEMDVYIVSVPPGSSENAFGAELLSSGLYQWVRPDWILYPLGNPDDPGYGQQWHLPKIGAPGAWRFTKGSPSVIVAFVDTGVDLDHPDLAPLLVAGFNSHWTWSDTHTEGGEVNDENGHGTCVTGAAIAVGNNNYGGCGVAWDLRIMPIRATNADSAAAGTNSSNIITGARWAANHGAKVVNCSWIGVAEPVFESLGQYVRARGALLIWPMDQTWPTGQATTFDHPNVVVVNGTNQSDAVSEASCNWGPGVDLAAPAKSLWIPVKGGGYAWNTGNSYAAPIVAAAAGLVWSIEPGLTSLQVEQALEWSAKDIGLPGQDDFFGHGRVDPYIAIVNVILGNVFPPHSPQWVTDQDRANAVSQWHVEY